MVEPCITISKEEYERMIKAEEKLELVTRMILKDSSNYGYSNETSKFIDIILGICRDEK